MQLIVSLCWFILAMFAAMDISIVVAHIVEAHGLKLGLADWAAWVQAIGSIAAIVGAFVILLLQHRRDREVDLIRRAEQIEDRKNEIILGQARTISNAYELVHVGTVFAERLIEVYRDAGPATDADRHAKQVDQIRSALDSFASPGTDQTAASAAIRVSMALTEVVEDVLSNRGSINPTVLARCEEKLAEAVRIGAQLGRRVSRFRRFCLEQGLQFDHPDFGNMWPGGDPN